jgi:hypothetical protein
MRVVETDNFGSDYPDEKFITESLPLLECQKIADDRNSIGGEYSRCYYKVVEDDYILQPGFEP